MSLLDEIKNASNRLAQTLHTAQATMLHLQSLLEMANQPLPDPPKAPLVGDEPSGIVAVSIDAAKMQHVYPGIVGGKFIRTSNCANGCGAWMGGSRSGGPPGTDPFGACPAPRFKDHVHEVGSCICDRWPADKRLREFIAEHGGAVSVLDCMVSFGIETRTNAIAMIGEAIRRGAIESTTDEIGTVWYQLATPGEPPASKVHPVESRELPTYGTERRDPTAPNVPDGCAMAGQSRVTSTVFHSSVLNAAVRVSVSTVKRCRTEYTAEQWATGPHFLAYMKTEPFNAWTAAQQNVTRDEFVAKYRDAPPQNRWGKTFSKFCGV